MYDKKVLPEEWLSTNRLLTLLSNHCFHCVDSSLGVDIGHRNSDPDEWFVTEDIDGGEHSRDVSGPHLSFVDAYVAAGEFIRSKS